MADIDILSNSVMTGFMIKQFLQPLESYWIPFQFGFNDVKVPDAFIIGIHVFDKIYFLNRSIGVSARHFDLESSQVRDRRSEKGQLKILTTRLLKLHSGDGHFFQWNEIMIFRIQGLLITRNVMVKRLRNLTNQRSIISRDILHLFKQMSVL